MFSIIYLCYVTCHTQWAWVTYGAGKLKQHAVYDGTPIWRMKSVVMTICKFCHVSENAVYNMYLTSIIITYTRRTCTDKTQTKLALLLTTIMARVSTTFDQNLPRIQT